MARKLASLELELKAERAGSQVAQTHLLEADQGQNEREAVWEAQRQILVDDSDRLRETLHEATRERDSLKMRVEALSGSGDDDDDDGDAGAVSGRGNASSMVDIVAERKAYEAEVGELTLTVTAMRDEVRSKDETMLKLQRYAFL
jgi:homeobox protein cut-like